MLTLGIVLGTLVSPRAQTAETVFRGRNPIFEPLPSHAGTPATTTFRSVDNNAVVTLALDSQGSYYNGYPVPGTPYVVHGSAPDGYTQIQLRAQDEVLVDGQAVSSSLRDSFIRVTSRSFGFMDKPPRDPAVGHCRGTQCPDMTEIYAAKNLRLTAGEGGTVDIVVNNRSVIDVRRDHEIRFTWLADAEYVPPVGRKAYACFTDDGRLVKQDEPCR